MQSKEHNAKTLTKRVGKILATAFVLASLLSAIASAQVKKPISKNGLLEALRIGGLTSGELVREVEKRGVDFALTEAVADELRRAGAKTELISAVSANYRSPAITPQPAAPSSGAPRIGLGLVVQDITPALAASFGLNDARGVLVNAVEKNYLGDQVGIERKDIILAINETPIKNSEALRQQVARLHPGMSLTLTIWRDGSLHKLTSGGANNLETTGTQASGNGLSGRGKLGLRVEPVTSEVAAQLKLDRAKGLLVTEVDVTGPAATAGIKNGDVIVEINGQSVRSLADVEPALAKTSAGAARLLIWRGGRTLTVELQPRAANASAK